MVTNTTPRFRLRTLRVGLLSRRAHGILSTILLAAVTWALLSPDPFSAVRDSPLGWLGLLNDKLLHISVFCGLTACIVSLAVRTAGFLPMTVVVALASYAVATELLQGFVPGRMCDPGDVLANGAGLILGVVCVHWLETLVSPSFR